MFQLFTHKNKNKTYIVTKQPTKELYFLMIFHACEQNGGKNLASAKRSKNELEVQKRNATGTERNIIIHVDH